MAKLEVIKYPAKTLRAKTHLVRDFADPKITKLVSDMVKTMEEAKGVGLAATQVGSDLRICVVEVNENILVLINPIIKSRSKKKEIAEEGCLSFPGKYFPVERSKKIKVVAENLTGKNLKIKAEGLLARILQHEIDHLDGILLIDRVRQEK